MTTQPQKRRLGRGLAALIGDDASEPPQAEEARGQHHIPIDLIRPNPHNPRKNFSEPELDELARSIAAKGLLQPLLVRPAEDGGYEIVAGERRWRAAQRAGVHDLPAIVRTLSDAEAAELALIENIQRADLNAIEEARGYARLIEEFGHTQEQLAHTIGKSRSHVANTMRLLNLPLTVRRYVELGKLTAGHARALIAVADPEALADIIVQHGYSVRQAEELARGESSKLKEPSPQPEKNADLLAVERELGEALGLKVAVTFKDNGGGTITITYKTLDQFEAVRRRLSPPLRFVTQL